MMELCGQPILGHVIDRVKVAVPDIIVATPDSDIAFYAQEKGCRGFVGSETDVLDRYYQATKYHGMEPGDLIVRICSDNPLTDPAVITHLLDIQRRSRCEYVSNTIRRTYPVGLDAEVFTVDALKRAWKRATESYDREHVTPYIYHHPEWFDTYNVTNDHDLSHLRWCIDTQEDFDRIAAIYNRAGGKPPLHFEDILQLTGELCASVN